jgi:hypothetical protein
LDCRPDPDGLLAGPPGAGKSTAQAALIQATWTQPEHWLPINADDFKDELLQQARQDGSYDSYLVPEEVRALEAAGEKFYPRELAALVHTESSILAKKARNETLESGMNVITDGTLGNEKQAQNFTASRTKTPDQSWRQHKAAPRQADRSWTATPWRPFVPLRQHEPRATTAGLRAAKASDGNDMEPTFLERIEAQTRREETSSPAADRVAELERSQPGPCSLS